mgnify:CR=1 FL=1
MNSIKLRAALITVAVVVAGALTVVYVPFGVVAIAALCSAVYMLYTSIVTHLEFKAKE